MGLNNEIIGATTGTVFVIIIWLNKSMMKRSILISSLTGPYVAIRTAKINRKRTDFND